MERLRGCAWLGMVAALMWGYGSAPDAFALEIEPASAAESGAASDETKPPARKRKAASPKGVELDWQTLEKALKKSRPKDLPLLVVCDGNESYRETLAEYARSRTFARTLRSFVLVHLKADDLKRPYPASPDRAKDTTSPERKSRTGRVVDRDPPARAGGERRSATAATVRERLELDENATACVVVLTFRERVVAKCDEELADRRKLGARLDRIAKVNRIFAKEERRVAKLLEKARYAFLNKKRRVAVLTVNKLAEKKAQKRMDEETRKSVTRVLDEFTVVAKKEMDRADALDAAFDYQEALNVYTRVRNEFPILDVQKRCVRRIGEIWQKLQIATGRTR